MKKDPVSGSFISMALSEGFEPSEHFCSPDFESGAFDRAPPTQHV